MQLTKLILEVINSNWVLFSELPLEGKVQRLSTYPYDDSKFYHVSSEENASSIMRNGLVGEEIWVSKGKPWENYLGGYCFELDLSGIDMFKDPRWKDEDEVYVINDPVSPDRITKVFEYFDRLQMREDTFAAQSSDRSVDGDKVAELIKKYEL